MWCWKWIDVQDNPQNVHVEEGQGGKNQNLQEHKAEQKLVSDHYFKTFCAKNDIMGLNDCLGCFDSDFLISYLVSSKKT